VTQQHHPSGTRHALTPAQALEAGLSLHREGRLREAARVYRALLELDAGHVAALHYLGVVATAEGRLDEAVELIGKAVALDPVRADAHNDLGIALAQSGRFEAAMAHYEKALALAPDHVGARNNLATALLALKRPAAAIGHLEKALALQPDMADLHLNMGNASAALGRHEAAVAHYRRTLALEPDFAEAHNNLGFTLATLNRPEQAIAEYERAIALKPDYFEAHNNLAIALAALKRHAAAIRHFDQALALKPGAPEIHNNLGNALAALKRHDDAVTHFLRAIELEPDFVEAHSNLGNALAALDRHTEAIAHYQKAIELKPDFAEAHCNLGNALGTLDRHDEAMACYRRALALDPDLAEAHASFGSELRTLGRLEEARRELEKAVALAPRRAELHRSLAESKRYTSDDPQLAAMEALLADTTSLSDDDRIMLHFALAKAQADTGAHEKSFRHLLAGNALKRRQLDYDEAGTFAAWDRVKAVFTADLIEQKGALGDPSEVPIFIVGMPRSGTTLIEQMLASHPKVFGAGELEYMSAAGAKLERAGSGGVPFPAVVPSLDAAALRAVAADYLTALRSLAPGAERITDKMPGNFRILGLIHLALPRARIIHARRDPLDTCLSCFDRLFASKLGFVYDLAELGRYYRAYEALMAHWRRVLPPGVMLEVQYEELVTDFEPQARRIVEFCGLTWDEACLKFYQTDRPVRTASVIQVRQPPYQDSIGRWRRHADMLRPLLDALNPGQRTATSEQVSAGSERGATPSQALDMALAMHRRGRLREAEQAYRDILRVDPGNAAALHYLGVVLTRTGRPDEAIAAIQAAIELKPGSAEAHNDLGIALSALGRFATAVAHHQAAVRLKPDFAAAHNNLANALESLGRHEDAIFHCERALAIRPDFAEAENNLANALAQLERPAEAVKHYQRAIMLSPDFAIAYSNLGNVLEAVGRSEQAIACFHKALAIAPDIGETHFHLAISLTTLGRLAEARQALETAVEKAPGRAIYYRHLAECKQFAAGDPHLAAMEAMAGNLATLTENDQIELHFALSKAYADIGEHERSFRQLVEGNRLRRTQIDYDEAATLALFDRIKTTFGFDLMRRNQGIGNPCPVPVFVIGMPRSGTTLVEQILASHPEIFGAGELMDMTKAVMGLTAPDGDPAVFPEIVPRMTPRQIHELGERYLGSLRATAPPAAARIVDKMPENFRWLGLIHMALPNARFIHMRRDPVDTCLSCFSKLFVGNLHYTYELGELGRYHNAYDALMAHWRAVLPPGILLEVRYEELVCDFEPQARRIIAHCGVEWDAHCLAFHETQRPVRTASARQVRQPLYRGSVGRWRPYAGMLRPLLDELGVQP
jgi:tetratricopeptide (TPR) repeat protein